MNKALDLGPDGLIIPSVKTLEEADAIVSASRYPYDLGTRGVAYPFIRASKWGLDRNYPKEYRRRTQLLVQLEDSQGLANASGILGCEGIDGVFIGPLDLSSSLGRPGDVKHPEVRQAIGAIESAARANDKVLASFALPGTNVWSMFDDRGYQMVATGVDLGLLKEAARGQVQAATVAPLYGPGHE